MAGRSEKVVGISEDRRLQRVVVLLSVLSFVVLTAAILVVYDSPMKGYEYSVYNSAPIIFWIAVIFSQLTGILLFYTYYGSGSRLWVMGFLQILLSNFILMTLYLFKGFIYLERTDSLSYVGYAKDIFVNGYFPQSNFYPFGSIIMSMTGSLSGQSMIMMSQIFPAIFFTAYTVGILCWSRVIFPEPRFVTSTMLASMPIFFAWFIPTLFNETLCVLMLPLFFFVLWKCMGGDARYKVLLALFVVFFIIGHPLVALTVLLFFGIIILNERVTRKENKTISVNMVLYSFVLLFGWIVYHALLVRDLRNIVEQFMGMTGGMSTFTNASVQASQIGLLSSLQSILVCTADDLVFAVLALVAGVMILRRGWRTHYMTVVAALFVIGGVYLAAIILMTYAHNPFRLINLNFIIIFTIPLVGFLLYSLRTNGRKRTAQLVSVVIALCMVSTVFTVYQDPNALFPNASVTRSEIGGAKWLVNDRDAAGFTFYTLQTKPWRYIDLAYGAEYKRDNYDIVGNDWTTSFHFRSFLDANDTSGGTTYLVFSTYDEMAYTQTWAATNKYNVDDFHQLTYLHTVNHLYKGGDMKVYARSW